MQLIEIEVDGYAEFQKKLQEILKDKEKSKNLFFLFSGSLNESGVSWCPDCVQFDEIWARFKTSHNVLRGTFVRVKVGSRDVWKQSNSPFRTDPKLKLKFIPTLIRWGSHPLKLDGDAINDTANLEAIFDL